jgi:glutamate synthase domain-containing protein 3
LILENVLGQRYIGAGLKGDAEIMIHGIPGNDLACFMDGPRIVTFGNAQDGVANTMSSGTIIIHGDAGDVLAYGMRGGRLFVRGDAGYRVGIHMKEYEERIPVIVIGGTARDYFGEYMAGGSLVLLGLDRKDNELLAGDFLGTGMHGGQIFLRGPVEKWQLGKEVDEAKIDDPCWEKLERHLADFSREFNLDPDQFARCDFTRLMPASHRPYGKIYVY